MVRDAPVLAARNRQREHHDGYDGGSGLSHAVESTFQVASTDVIVTSAFFVEAFTVANGKINLLGGVWDWYKAPTVDDGTVHRIAMVILLQYEHDEGGKVIPLTIEVIGPDDGSIDKQTAEVTVPIDASQGFVPCVFDIAFTRYGVYKFILQSSAGAGHVVSLTVRPAS